MNLHATNNLLQAAKEVFAGLKGNCFVFCNSTDTIYSLMQQLDLLDESAVFCSEKSVEKLKGLKFENVSDIWDKDIMRRYNWLTSRFYNAVDIELEEKPTILLLTDCYLRTIPHLTRIRTRFNVWEDSETVCPLSTISATPTAISW